MLEHFLQAFMPLIAGPATITTLLLLVQSLGVWLALSVLIANLALLALAFAYSDWLGRLNRKKNPA